jgi:hypothetical protein
MEEIQLEGQRILLIPCDHCLAIPTEMDAARGIAEYATDFGFPPCAICGARIKPDLFLLTHIVGASNTSARWVAIPEHFTGEQCLLVQPPRWPAPAAQVHRPCAIRVMPHLPSEVLAPRRSVQYFINKSSDPKERAEQDKTNQRARLTILSWLQEEKTRGRSAEI